MRQKLDEFVFVRTLPNETRFVCNGEHFDLGYQFRWLGGSRWVAIFHNSKRYVLLDKRSMQQVMAPLLNLTPADVPRRDARSMTRQGFRWGVALFFFAGIVFMARTARQNEAGVERLSAKLPGRLTSMAEELEEEERQERVRQKRSYDAWHIPRTPVAAEPSPPSRLSAGPGKIGSALRSCARMLLPGRFSAMAEDIEIEEHRKAMQEWRPFKMSESAKRRDETLPPPADKPRFGRRT